MKKLAVLLGVLTLAGCAGNNQGLSLNLIEDPLYLRAEHDFEQNFVQIQRAVFRHQDACHDNVRFEVDAGNPNYARIIKPLVANATNYSDMMILSMAELRSGVTRAKLYSYYVTTRDQAREMFNVVLHPEQCGAQPNS
jgi:hypothetical protein